MPKHTLDQAGREVIMAAGELKQLRAAWEQLPHPDDVATDEERRMIRAFSEAMQAREREIVDNLKGAARIIDAAANALANGDDA